MNTEKKVIEIEFCADHGQYFPGRPSKSGYLYPVIGAGDNEADAYKDAADQCYCLFDNLPDNALPKRKGNAKRGLNYYFGKGTTAEIRKERGDSELYVYCIIYIPEHLNKI